MTIVNGKAHSKLQPVAAAIVGFALIAGSWKSAQAYPEFSGDGYFSCTSCHASTSGGDLVTAYGRSFAEEKLARWAYEGEAKPLHGKVPMPEWLLLGGHFRQIQINYEDSRMKEGHYFTMQRELDVGVNFGQTWAYVSGSYERKDSDPYQFDLSKPEIPKWIVRQDLFEMFSIRAGRTMPKFGLNVPDHNAYVRQRVGLGAGTERRLTEVSYFSELVEVNLSQSSPYLPSTKADRNALDAAPEVKETYANASVFLFERQRLSVSFLNSTQSENTGRYLSLSGALAAGKNVRILLEQNSGKKNAGSVDTTLHNSYVKFISVALKGVYPNFVYERHLQSNDSSSSLIDRFALGIAIHPRPHVDLTGSVGLQRNLKTFQYGQTANFIFHYWI